MRKTLAKGLLIVIFFYFISFPTRAAIDANQEINLSSCGVDLLLHPELEQLRSAIATADNLDQAKMIALTPTDAAISALSKASSMMPFSDDLQNAYIQLADARSRIEIAETPEQVADEFSGMMLAGLDDDSIANVNIGKIGCNYSTGEVIGIVVGLILGIIPGLILLIVLC